MPPGAPKARDLDLLDAVDAFAREAIAAQVWRVTREARDPLIGSPSRSRWCNGSFDVLYTACDADGAVAEIHALLALQPVFPSRDRWHLHQLQISATQTLRLADLETLAKLGVDVARYRDRDYTRTQAIGDAAYFLGFDGLVVPSARWTCLNIVLFTDRVPPDQIALTLSSDHAIDWSDWRKRNRR